MRDISPWATSGMEFASPEGAIIPLVNEGACALDRFSSQRGTGRDVRRPPPLRSSRTRLHARRAPQCDRTCRTGTDRFPWLGLTHVAACATRSCRRGRRSEVPPRSSIRRAQYPNCPLSFACENFAAPFRYIFRWETTPTRPLPAHIAASVSIRTTWSSDTSVPKVLSVTQSKGCWPAEMTRLRTASQRCDLPNRISHGDGG